MKILNLILNPYSIKNYRELLEYYKSVNKEEYASALEYLMEIKFSNNSFDEPSAVITKSDIDGNDA